MLHDPDLAGRGVGPQQVPLDVDVERVPQVARRVVGRDVEHLEVGEVVLDLRALVDDEPELAEDLGDLAHRLDARVERAAADRPAGRRDVDRLGGQARRSARSRAASSPRSARAASIAPRTALATAPTRGRSSAGSAADPAQDRGQAALLAEDVELERLERGDVRRSPRSTPGRRRGAPRGRASGRRGPRPSFLRWSGNQEPSSVVDVEGSSSDRGLAARAVATSGDPAARIRRSWRARRSCRTSPRRGRRGRPGSCGRSRRRPS